MISPLYEKLIDKVCMLISNHDELSDVDLFQTACRDLEIVVTTFFKEHVVHLGSFVCQIVLNNDIFITADFGATHDLAYRNSVRKFINLCFSKRNLKLKYPENNPDLLYDEIKMSINNIQLGDDLKNQSLQIIKDFNKNNSIDISNKKKYENIKHKLKESGMNLTESYRSAKENIVTCSIFLNELLLIQQNEGKDLNEALENTISSFFTTYEIISEENSIDLPNDILNKEDILRKLGQLFKQKKNNDFQSKNYWDIIQECANTLNYDLSVKSGQVKVNDIIILDIKEKDEYIGSIKVGKELVNQLSKEEKRVPETMFKLRSSVTYMEERRVPPTIFKPRSSVASMLINFQKTTKIYNEIEREEKLKTIVIAVNETFIKNEEQSLWNVLNCEFFKENFKVEPCYKNKFKEIKCTLKFQGWDIISGKGSGVILAREEASRKLLMKYLQVS